MQAAADVAEQQELRLVRQVAVEAGRGQQAVREVEVTEIEQHDLIVDAMFGTGLSAPLTGFYETVVADLNEQAYAWLRERIVTRHFGPHERLGLQVLADELGVAEDVAEHRLGALVVGIQRVECVLETLLRVADRAPGF